MEMLFSFQLNRKNKIFYVFYKIINKKLNNLKSEKMLSIVIILVTVTK